MSTLQFSLIPHRLFNTILLSGQAQLDPDWRYKPEPDRAWIGVQMISRTKSRIDEPDQRAGLEYESEGR